MDFSSRKIQLLGILFVLALLFTAVIQSCGGGSSGSSKSLNDETVPDRSHLAMRKIIGADQEGYFLDEEGNRFFPWGMNYTSPESVGLLDDNLHSDAVWHTVSSDFAEMRQLTANAVRIHLQYNRFMLDPWTIDPRALDALDRLVKIAEANNLYLIVTGLGAYRKADSPSWYDSLSDEERWNTQALFWKLVAGRLRNKSAVFAYDLMNEPVVSSCENPEACDWLVGDGFGGYHFVQSISLEQGQSTNETMAAWIEKLTKSIRSEDSRTLITIGSLPITPLVFYAEHLDFMSPHIYPRSESMDELVNYILSAPDCRPLVIEEFFNLHCSAEELSKFLLAIDGHYHGLFGHYWGQTPEELNIRGDVEALLQNKFYTFFMESNPNKQ